MNGQESDGLMKRKSRSQLVKHLSLRQHLALWRHRVKKWISHNVGSLRTTVLLIVLLIIIKLIRLVINGMRSEKGKSRDPRLKKLYELLDTANEFALLLGALISLKVVRFFVRRRFKNVHFRKPSKIHKNRVGR